MTRYGEVVLGLELKVWREGRPDPLSAGLTQLDNETPRKIETVFNQYSSGDEHGFTKTVVPVKRYFAFLPSNTQIYLYYQRMLLHPLNS